MAWCATSIRCSSSNQHWIAQSFVPVWEGNITQHLAGMLFALKCRPGKIVAESFEKVYAIVHMHSKNQKHYLFYLTIGSLTAALLSYGLLASRG
jgi:hypothetical protein